MKFFSRKSAQQIATEEIASFSSSPKLENAAKIASLAISSSDRVVTLQAIQALRAAQDSTGLNEFILPKCFIGESQNSQFKMAVLDIFEIRDKGTVLVGVVSSGTIAANALLTLQRSDGTDIEITCIGLELLKNGAEPVAGVTVGVMCSGITAAEVQQGEVIRGR